jgi:hypothetical protein
MKQFIRILSVFLVVLAAGCGSPDVGRQGAESYSTNSPQVPMPTP